jgi:glycosyltransferase involved in cell wall biosynthesis
MFEASVIITNHNNGKFIGRCIRSCLKQSLKNYEIIVVDDASTDNSADIIKSFDKINPIFLDKNVGQAEASNIGVKKAMGSLIIRVDSDDYINENTLLFMSEILLNNPDIGFVYSDYFIVNEKEEKIKRLNIETIKDLYTHGAGIMFRKINLEAIGLYDPQLRHAEDYDLLIRYFKNFDGYHLKIPLYRYRQHKGNITKVVGERNEYRKMVEKKHGLKDIKL